LTGILISPYVRGFCIKPSRMYVDFVPDPSFYRTSRKAAKMSTAWTQGLLLFHVQIMNMYRLCTNRGAEVYPAEAYAPKCENGHPSRRSALAFSNKRLGYCHLGAFCPPLRRSVMVGGFFGVPQQHAVSVNRPQ